jgi:integrase
MSRGDGRIYLRGQIYWACYYLRGTQHRESTNTSEEKGAQKFLKARMREVGADLLGARTFTTPKASRLTVAELCEALKADFELRGKASAQNLSHLKRVETDFGTRRATELTAEKIDAYVKGRLADKTDPKGEAIPGDRPATVNRTLQMLGQCYALAIRRGHLSRDRAPFIRHLSEAGNARQGFFSEQEFTAVVSHLPEDLKDFARFAFITGMRKGEATSLTWSDLEGDSLTLRGENSKNGDARTVPLVGELAEIIERRKAARQVKENGTARMVEFIFHRDGAPVAEFRKSWATACKKAGVAGRLFHDLRRSAVRNMTQAGTPQAVAMKISGHKTASMFQRYNIVATDDLRTALARTEAYREAEAAKQPQVVSMR